MRAHARAHARVCTRVSGLEGERPSEHVGGRVGAWAGNQAGMQAHGRASGRAGAQDWWEGGQVDGSCDVMKRLHRFVQVTREQIDLTSCNMDKARHDEVT